MSKSSLCTGCKSEYLEPGENYCFKCSKDMKEFRLTLWAAELGRKKKIPKNSRNKRYDY